MHGNVSEWVQDCYANSYSAVQPSNGAAYSPDTCSDRVMRGGSWAERPEYLRSARRFHDTPSLRIYMIGFRVARTL